MVNCGAKNRLHSTTWKSRQIARQIPATLRLRLTENEEDASRPRYTRAREHNHILKDVLLDAIQQESKAIGHFRNAIELVKIRVAYAGIVDCYLRLYELSATGKQRMGMTGF